MIEISILISLTISPDKRVQRTRLIKILRALVLLIALILPIAWTIICSISPEEMNSRLELGTIYLPIAGVLFFALTVALFVSIMMVICCLKAK